MSVSNISCGKNYYIYNLATDMIMETDVVFSDGFRSEIPLSELEDCVPGTARVAEIHSRHPKFSWMIASDKKDTYQRKYRILMATSLSDLDADNGSSWDSGDVTDSNSVCVQYSGPELQPSTIYYWKVRIQDSKGRTYDYSDPKGFMTAIELDDYTSVLPLEKFKQQPVSMRKIGSSLMADFGNDAFGQLFLKFNSFTGENDHVKLHLGEAIDDDGFVESDPSGCGRYSNYDVKLIKGYNRYMVEYPVNPKNTDPNVNGGAVPVLMPRHIGEVMPFRYVEIDDYRGPLLYSNISRHVVNYPFHDDASYFECDDTVLNQIWNLCKHTIKAASFAGTYVDGDRERITYEADTYIAQLSHFAVDYQYSIDRNTLERLMYHPTWPTEWILMTPMIAYNDYLYTGDISFLERYYEDLKLRTLWQYRDSDDGLLHSGNGLHDSHLLNNLHTHSQYIKDIVDWPYPEQDNYDIDDCNASTNAFYYQSLATFSKIADAVGNSHDARTFARLSREVRETINRDFIEEENLYSDNLVALHSSLHGNMYPMAFGMVPDSCWIPVTNFVIGKGMSCSVFGAQFLVDALYEFGYQDNAFDLLADTSTRSWYNMIRMGSTMTTEAWNANIKDNMDWNHAWGTAPANLIVRRLMGIRPVAPGFSRVEVRPQISTLEYASVRTPTPRGPISVDIRTVKGKRRLQVSIPPNTTAEIYVPGRNVPEIVGSGDYQFEIR